MEINEIFQEELKREFQERLRIRWNGKKQAYTVEQRVGKNIIGQLPRELFKHNDFYRQGLAEGYKPIMDVAVSETMRCPSCNTKLTVPNRETKQFRCTYCQSKGRRSLLLAGYYPLNSFLINHLKTIDPLRNMEVNQVQRLQDYNEKLMEREQAKLSDEAEAYTSDNLNRLMGILQTGYSGMKNNSILPESPGMRKIHEVSK